MKLTTSFLRRALLWRALAASLIIGLLAGAISAEPLIQYSTQGQTQAQGQAQTGAQQPQAPEAERQAAQKVQSAADMAAQLQAGTDFVKQFPKSTLRPQVAKFVASKIKDQTDLTQRIALAETFSTVFTEASEKAMLVPVLLDGYLRANRVDDAFRVAPAWFEKNPEDVSTMMQMALSGVDQIKREGEKAKHLFAPSQQYATQTVALIESDKKPADITPEQWQEYKTKWLPHLYQSLGILSLMTSNNDDAKAKLSKASSLNPTDPLTQALLANVVDNEYQTLAQQHKDMPAGPPKEEKLKQALAKMEQAMTLYAQAVALSDNNPQYQQIRDQVAPLLESYYKFLHNGSTTGLQELINKYKK